MISLFSRSRLYQIAILSYLFTVLMLISPAFATGDASPDQKRVSLGALMPVSMQQGWGGLAIDKSVGGNKLKIVDREFATGLGTHANSEILYHLEGAYDRFEAWVGVDAGMADHSPSARFRVLADGKEIFESGVMRADTPAKQVIVSVKGVHVLALVVDGTEDGVESDHADWAEAVLVGNTKLSAPAVKHPAVKHKVKASGIELALTGDGKIAGVSIGRRVSHLNLRGESCLLGCPVQEKVTDRKLKGGGVEFKKILRHRYDGECILMERFTPKKNSVRWEIEISGNGGPWSTPISTRLRWPVTPNTRFWTAWSDPELASSGWRDPFVTRPMGTMMIPYGGLWEQVGGYMVLPIVTLLEPENGLSLVMSPEDTVLNGMLSTMADGTIVFTRTNNRISSTKPVRFAMDIVPHEPDIRAGLGWLVRRYPHYFDPPNSLAHEIAGCGAYSFYEGELDTAKLKKMGFRVNWKASYDFPYMGMFLPPVEDTEEWKPFDKRASMSVKKLADYSRRMRQSGFYVLSYFDSTELGNHVNWPPPPRKAKNDQDLWKDANDCVYYMFGNAWLRSPDGSPTYSWEGSIVVDPGDESYRKHLIEQARLHVQKLPDASGICIDRLDWMRLYNPAGDDGVSWINGKVSRFFLLSWKRLMSEIGPIMHSAGKVVFTNSLYRRLDAMREVDGIYDEYGNNGTCLNGSTLLGLRKPVIAWTYSEEDLKPDPDAFFQRHLYMGAFPTAPVPNNDHTINPSEFADKWYLDYGPMLDTLRGRKWVLVPHVVQVSRGVAKANVFEVPGAYVVPVTFGGSARRADVVLRNLPDLIKDGARLKCEALHPGTEKWVPLSSRPHDGKVTLDVPLERGCAMVRVSVSK